MAKQRYPWNDEVDQIFKNSKSGIELQKALRKVFDKWVSEKKILKTTPWLRFSSAAYIYARRRNLWKEYHTFKEDTEDDGPDISDRLKETREEIDLREESMAARRHELLFGNLKKIPRINIPKTDGEKPFEIAVKNPDKPVLMIVNSPLVGTLAPMKETEDIFKNAIKLAAVKNADAILITGNLLYCLVEKYGKRRPYHTQVVGVEPDVELLEDSYPSAVLKELGPLAERISKHKIVFLTIKVYLDSLFKAIKKKFLNKDGKPIYKGNVYVVLGEMEEAIAMYYANEALRTEVFKEKAFAHKNIRELRASLKIARKTEGGDVDELTQKINDWEVYDKLLALMGNVSPSVINDRRQLMINYLAHCIEENIPNAKVVGVGDVYLRVGRQLVSVTNDKTVDSIRGGLAGRLRRGIYSYVKAHSGERVPHTTLGSGMNPWGTGLYASYRIRDKKSTLDDVRMSHAVQLPACIDSGLYRETVRRMLKATASKVIKLANTSNFESGVAILKFFEPAPIERWEWYKSDFLANQDIFGSDKKVLSYVEDDRAKNIYIYKEGCTHYGASYVARYPSLDDPRGRYIKYHNQVLFEAFTRDGVPVHLYLIDGDIHHWMNYQTYKEGNVKWKDPEQMLAELTKLERDGSISVQEKLKLMKVLTLDNMLVAGIMQPEDQVEGWGRAYAPYADFFKAVIERALKAGIKVDGLLGIVSAGQGNHNENTFKRGDVRFSEARLTCKEIYTFLLEHSLARGETIPDLKKHIKACETGGVGLAHGTISVTSLGDKAYEYCIFMKHKSGQSSKAEDNMRGMIRSFSERGSTDDYEEDRFTLNFGGDDHLGGHAVTRNAFHYKTGGQMFSGPFGFKLDFPKQNLFSGICGVAAGGPTWGPFSVISFGFRPVRKLAAYKITLPKDLFDNPV